MPEYNALQTSRLDTWVRKLLGIRNGGVMPTLAPELAAAINLPAYQDTDLLAGYVPWGASPVVAAVAGQNSLVSLINGFSSHVVMVRALMGSDVASTFSVYAHGLTAGAGIAPSQAGYRDGRRPVLSFPLGGSGLNLTTGTNVGAPAGNFRLFRMVILAQDSVQTPWYIMPPGDSITFMNEVVNTTLYCTLEGYMRAVDPDELTA